MLSQFLKNDIKCRKTIHSGEIRGFYDYNLVFNSRGKTYITMSVLYLGMCIDSLTSSTDGTQMGRGKLWHNSNFSK